MDDGYMYLINDPAPGAPVRSNKQDKAINLLLFAQVVHLSFKYGWMKVNVSTDGNTLTIKEIALSNVNNKVIKVGAK
jgi:hypothetical protein